jgi:hypothetical protein
MGFHSISDESGILWASKINTYISVLTISFLCHNRDKGALAIPLFKVRGGQNYVPNFLAKTFTMEILNA